MLGRVVGGNTIPPTTRPSHRPKDVRAGLRARAPPDWMQRYFSNS